MKSSGERARRGEVDRCDHTQNLLGKFGVHSRAGLIARAYLLGHAGRLSQAAAL
jgi:hypothetical protein